MAEPLKWLNTAADVIEALGGVVMVSVLMERKQPQVSSWKKHNRFPPTLAVKMASILRSIGCEAPAALWQMEPPPQSTKATLPSSQPERGEAT